MDELRWILLVLGIVIVAMVYLFSRFQLWQKLGTFSKRFQQKNYGPDLDARREPVRFDESDEIEVDDDHGFDFPVSEFSGEVPTVHVQSDEEPITGDDWQAQQWPAQDETVVSADQLQEMDTHAACGHDTDEALDEALDEASDQATAAGTEQPERHIPPLDKPLETEVEPLQLDDVNEAAESWHQDLPDGVEPLVLVLTLMSGGEHWFQGEALKNALQAEGLHFGAMDIFHYLPQGSKHTLFSVASVLEPGSFDMQSLHELATPGVTLFCQLPGPLKSFESFETMLGCARKLAARLHGRVCDEKRNPLTNQAIGHYRDRIEAFERKLVLAQRS